MPQSGNVDSDTAEGSSDANNYSVFVRNPHPCSHPPPRCIFTCALLCYIMTIFQARENNMEELSILIVIWYMTSGSPQLIETLEKPGIYCGFWNSRNSLEFCIKTLNHLEICERHKK